MEDFDELTKDLVDGALDLGHQNFHEVDDGVWDWSVKRGARRAAARGLRS